jgi:hypothetical protein
LPESTESGTSDNYDDFDTSLESTETAESFIFGDLGTFVSDELSTLDVYDICSESAGHDT